MLLRTYLPAELSVELNGCTARRTVLLFDRSVFISQLKVREFSADSVFQDPCLSYTLRDVICSYCSTCR
jgi:hypothetical protein